MSSRTTSKYGQSRYSHLIILISMMPIVVLAQNATFQGVGDLPGGDFKSCVTGVSADGSVVVGYSEAELCSVQNCPIGDTEAFRWVEGIMTSLAHLPSGPIGSEAHAVSADGHVVVGKAWNSLNGNPSPTPRAVRWDRGMAEIDRITDIFPQRAFGVSADGSVVIGECSDDRTRPFIWRNGLLQRPNQLPGGASVRFITAVSPDGTKFGGACTGQGGWTFGCTWTIGEEPEIIQVPDDPLASIDISALVHDGNTFVGSAESYARQGHMAFVQHNGKFTWLGDLPGGYVSSGALGASADGLVVIGYGLDETYDQSGYRAIIWDNRNGMRTVESYLDTEYGLDLSGWRLTEATGISTDGLTIVGNGINPDGFREGWIVRIVNPPTILRSDPPDGFVDAREDVDPIAKTSVGPDRVRIVFARGTTNFAGDGPVNVTSFEIQDTAGTVPSIASVLPVVGLPDTYDIILERSITPGAWTTLGANVLRAAEWPASDAKNQIRIGYLPGDVNSNGRSSPSDILEMIDDLNFVRVPALMEWQSDIDRSGATLPADIVRLIDLLNGLNTSRPWLGATLPSISP